MNNSKEMKKNILMFVFCGLLLAGCREKVPPPEMDRLVEINFSTKLLLSSLSTQDENKITKIILYGFDKDEKFVDTVLIIPNSSSTDISRTILIPKEITSFHAIANPSAGIGEWVLSSLTVSEIERQICDFSTTPVSPFLMSGKGKITGNKVDIVLIRVVARIDFIGVEGYQIESVKVTKTRDKGFVFRHEPVTIPSSAQWIGYTIDFPEPVVYIAESKSDPSSAEFIINGKYEGETESRAIHLDTDIVRNTYYRVEISPKTSITITIPDWEDGGDIDPITF